MDIKNIEVDEHTRKMLQLRILNNTLDRIKVNTWDKDLVEELRHQIEIVVMDD